MKIISHETLRFLIAGGCNTLAGYLLYLTLLSFSNYYIAYTLSFLASILIAFVINSCFVFKARILWRRLVQYPVLYFLQYFVGLILLFILITWLGVNEKVAPLINAALLTPLSFIANKWFFSRGII